MIYALAEAERNIRGAACQKMQKIQKQNLKQLIVLNLAHMVM